MKEETKCKCNEKSSKCETEAITSQQTDEKVIVVEQNLDYKDKYLRMLAEVES